jgi:hypothetical protein
LELPTPVAASEGRRHRLIGPLLEWPALAGIAAGEAALTYLAAKVTTLGPTVRQLFTAAVGIASVFTAVVAARLLDRLAVGSDGKEDPRRRRRLDVGTGLLAGVSGIAIALAVARMRETFLKAVYDGMAGQSAALVIDQRYLPWLLVLGVALLGLGAAIAYAAIPDNPGSAARWAKAFLRWLAAGASRRRRQRAQQAEFTKQQDELAKLRQEEGTAAARAAELEGELGALATAVKVAQEDAALTYYTQASAGDAAIHDTQEYLCEQLARRRRGIRQRLKDLWRGRDADVLDPLTEIASLATPEGLQDWLAQVDAALSPAKLVLLRRGELREADLAPALMEPDRPKYTVQRMGEEPASGNGKPRRPPSLMPPKGELQ